MTTLEILKEIYDDLRGGAKFNDENFDTLVYPQDFVILNLAIFSICDKANESSLIRKIATSLKKNNCLFYLSDAHKNLSEVRSAIASLKRKRIIYPTEKLNIYLANPYYIRRGEILSVLYTTIKMLENEELTTESVRDRKKIKIETREMKKVS